MPSLGYGAHWRCAGKKCENEMGKNMSLYTVLCLKYMCEYDINDENYWVFNVLPGVLHEFGIHRVCWGERR